ncbi:MAG: ABC transporter permease [Thermoanaerobaculia bacterium]
MVISENFRIALRALRANKMRSILTTLGIIIGVAAVIAVVSIVQGLQFMITRELQRRRRDVRDGAAETGTEPGPGWSPAR